MLQKAKKGAYDDDDDGEEEDDDMNRDNNNNNLLSYTHLICNISTKRVEGYFISTFGITISRRINSHKH